MNPGVEAQARSGSVIPRPESLVVRDQRDAIGLPIRFSGYAPRAAGLDPT